MGKRADGSYDVKWLTPQATEMTEADWNLPHARFLSYVLAAPREGGKPLFVVLNGTDTPVEITFPDWPGVASLALPARHLGRPGSMRSTLPPGANWGAHVRCVLAFAGEP